MAGDDEYDVFLSHPGGVKGRVLDLSDRLRELGVRPWVDIEQVPAGTSVDQQVVEGMARCKCCAVFVVSDEVGGWVQAELQTAVGLSVKDPSFRVFLVLLPGVPLGFDYSRLPSLATSRVWVDLRSTDDSEELDQMVRAIRGEPPRRIGVDSINPSSRECPYVGYRPFGVDDTDQFWGRGAEVQKMVERLTKEPFLAVAGNSGSGKSSAVLAGLVPRLGDESRTDGGVDRVAVLTPGIDPLRKLTSELAELHPQRDVSSIRASLLADFNTLGTLSKDGVCWVVDQFEEVFTLAGDDRETDAFVNNLLLASRPGGGAKAVLVIRSDFIGQTTRYPGLSDRFGRHQILIGEMDAGRLREVIEQPAAAMHVKLERGLTERMLSEGAADPGMLPLVQYTMRELWSVGDGQLTHAAYEEIGGLRGSLTRQTETILAKLSDEQVELAREMLTRMVRIGEGEHDTKRPLTLGDAYSLGEKGDVNTVLGQFSTARLVRADTNQIELTHDSLLQTWPQLKEWVAEERQDIRTRDSLSREAKAWEAAVESRISDEGYLLVGHRLDSALQWAGGQRGLHPAVAGFLSASAEAEQARASALERRRRWIVGLSLTTSVVLLGVASLALVQWRTANERKAEAESLAVTAEENAAEAESIALTAEAAAARANNPSLATALALEAMARTGSPSDRQASEVGAAVETWAESDYLPYPPLRDHSEDVRAVAFSPDGTLLASGGDDQSIRIWDSETRQVTALYEGHTDQVLALAFSPDGGLLASTSGDSTVRLWELASGRMVGELTGHTAGVLGVGFSPGGDLLASAGDDQTIRLWNVETRQLASVLDGHTGPVFAISYSSDGAVLASTSTDGTVRLWDTATGQTTAVLEDHTAEVWGVAFSPDGSLLASTSADATVRLWDARTGDSIDVLQGHTAGAWGVAFSPDGSRLVSTSDDQTIRVWDVETGGPVAVLEGHTASVWGVAFSPDGTLMASTGSDYVVRFWDADTFEVALEFEGHTAATWGVAFSPDGTLVASASTDETVRVWNLAKGVAVAVLEGHTGPVLDVAFSPDGTLLASTGTDNTVRLWDPATGASLELLEGHTGSVFDVAFSPDGAFVASTSTDETIRVWDAVTGDVSEVLRAHAGAVWAVAFSPDGTLLGSASDDQTVRIWNRETGKMAAILEGHTASIWGLAFSPDGALVASTSSDGAVRLVPTPVAGVACELVAAHLDTVMVTDHLPSGSAIEACSDLNR